MNEKVIFTINEDCRSEILSFSDGSFEEYKDLRDYRLQGAIESLDSELELNKLYYYEEECSEIFKLINRDYIDGNRKVLFFNGKAYIIVSLDTN